MKIFILTLAILGLTMSLTLKGAAHDLSTLDNVHDDQLVLVHLQSAGNGYANTNTNTNANGYANTNGGNGGNRAINSGIQYANNYRTQTAANPPTDAAIMNMRTSYLAGLPAGQTVNYNNAVALQAEFATPMGAAILAYFAARAVQPNGQAGLNIYGLTQPNFRLWMAIKVLSGSDTNLYARSLTIDKGLFTEIITKANAARTS